MEDGKGSVIETTSDAFKGRAARGKAAQETAGQKVGAYVEKHRVPIVAILALAVAGVIGYTVSVFVSSRASENALARIEAIQKTLATDSSSLDSAALNERRKSAMDDLAPLISKGSVAGVRANMLAAEIAWQEGNYSAAAGYWKSAQAKSKKAFGREAYTAPLALFNEAVSLEECGKAAEAAALYGEAAKTEDFMLFACALFNSGRAYEECGDWAKAKEAYSGLVSMSPGDSWASLAKSRLIALEAAGRE